MKKIILVLISSLTFLAISSSANAIKVGALYLDTAGFFGEIKVGIEAAGAEEGIELTGANSQSDVAKESEFIDTLNCQRYWMLLLCHQFQLKLQSAGSCRKTCQKRVFQ